MIKEGKFGPSEAIWLTVITITAKLIYSSPAMVSFLVGNAGWYMTLISAAVAAVGFTFIYLLLKKFPGKDIIEIFEITLGRYVGFIFSALLALLMMYIAAVRAREVTEVLKVYVFPITPMEFILISFFLASAILNIIGLESIARFSKLIAYFIVLGLFFVFALGQQNYSIHRIFPILGYGIGKTFYNGVLRSSIYGEVIILAVFAKSLQGIKNIKKIGYISLALSGFLSVTELLAFVLTFSYNVEMEVTSPMYEMATLIDYGRFLQRVEPIFLFIMCISSIISIAVVSYTFVSIYCKMFRIEDAKPVILAASIIFYVIAISQKSMSDVIFKNVQDIRNLGGLIFYIPPIIALIAAKLRNLGGTNDA